jgi:peroxiredoxin
MPRRRDSATAKLVLGAVLPDMEVNGTGDSTGAWKPPGGHLVIYVYPMIGNLGHPLPKAWDVIPGARGCTPESCAFRDHHPEIAAAEATILGWSSQSTQDQEKAVDRLHLPFSLVSDPDMRLARLLHLPTFTADDTTYHERLTLIVHDRVVEKVFHPICAPAEHPDDVLRWLQMHPPTTCRT